MRVLIYGAGTAGSLYGALLARSGNDVGILTWGERRRFLRKQGLRYQLGGQEGSLCVRVLDRLGPEDRYDYILVDVCREKLPAALERLRENCSPTLVTVCSGLEPYEDWERLAGKGRVVPLVPGVEGELAEGVVRARLLPSWFQPTAFGEISGADTYRVRNLKKLLQKAGVPCRTVPDLRRWQIGRLACLLPLAELCGRKAWGPGELRRAAAGLRGNLNLLREKGIPLSRGGRLLRLLPEGLTAWGLRAFFRRSSAGVYLCSRCGSLREEFGDCLAALG